MIDLVPQGRGTELYVVTDPKDTANIGGVITVSTVLASIFGIG
jgi:hypothetical protein